VGDDAGPGALALICHVSQGQASRQKQHQLPIEEGVKQIPENSVDEPGPLSKGQLLPWEYVTAPSQLFTLHHTDIQHGL
jgi:hypothetical protein